MDSTHSNTIPIHSMISSEIILKRNRTMLMQNLMKIHCLLSVSLNGHHRTIHGGKANELLHIIHGEKANVLHHTTLGGREEKGLHLTTLGEVARELHRMTLGELERREFLPTALGALGNESLPITH